jgi:hypothetical protein
MSDQALDANVKTGSVQGLVDMTDPAVNDFGRRMANVEQLRDKLAPVGPVIQNGKGKTDLVKDRAGMGGAKVGLVARNPSRDFHGRGFCNTWPAGHG